MIYQALSTKPIYRSWYAPLIVSILLLLAIMPRNLPGVEDGGDAPPSVVALIDASRSSGPHADRIHLLSDALLPWYGERRVWSFDQHVNELSDSGVSALAYTSIVSDYIQAFQAIDTAEIQPDLLVVFGNGFMDVVHAEMPESYIQDLPPGSARDVINRAAHERFATSFQAMLSNTDLPLLILNPGRSETGSLWTWLKDGRADLATVILDDLSLRQVMQSLTDQGLQIRGRLLGGDVVDISNTITPIEIPEGSSHAEIIIHAKGNIPDYELGLSDANGPLPHWDGQGEEPVGAYTRWNITAGVGRHVVLGGAHDGLSLQVSLVGSEQDYEMAVRYHRHIDHEMAVSPPPHTEALYTHDRVNIEHQWRRGLDGGAISQRLAAAILEESSLNISGAEPQPQMSDDGMALILPEQAGEATLELAIAERWQDVVETEPLSFSWQSVAPLTLRGGWEQRKVYDGSRAQLRFRREGGRRPLSAVVVELAGPESAQPSTISVPLELDPDRGEWIATVVFTDRQRGDWSILVSDPIQGIDETGRWLIEPDQADVIMVQRNWLPLLLGLVALLLLLLALLLWWLASRPRWRNEVLLSAGRHIKLADCPGPRARDTSCLFTDIEQSVVVRKTRSGHEICSIEEGSTVYVNARPVRPGAPLSEGNDIEVINAGQRRHGQFFTDSQHITEWGSDQAQIDPMRDLGEEYLVVDLSDEM